MEVMVMVVVVVSSLPSTLHLPLYLLLALQPLVGGERGSKARIPNLTV